MALEAASFYDELDLTGCAIVNNVFSVSLYCIHVDPW